MDVLLVAAKKDKIADYTGVVSAVGKKPVVVDVDAFALQNAFETNYADDAGKIVALLNAGASAININLVSGGTSLFTRDVGIGGNAFTEAVQKELGLPFEGAEDAKRGLPVDGVRSEDVRPVLHAVTENVLLEIEKTFDFFKATSASDHIDRIVVERRRLAWSRTSRRRCASASAPRSSASIRSGTCQSIRPRCRAASAADYAPVCAVAMGLALRKDGDR